MSENTTPPGLAQLLDHGDAVWQEHRDRVVENGPTPQPTDTDEPLTEAEEKRCRGEIDGWLIACSANSDNKLHIPGGNGEPVCAHRTTLHGSGRIEEWKEKDTAVYPLGWKDVCRYCSAIWREYDAE
jgi:hypothetical protein